VYTMRNACVSERVSLARLGACAWWPLSLYAINFDICGKGGGPVAERCFLPTGPLVSPGPAVRARALTLSPSLSSPPPAPPGPAPRPPRERVGRPDTPCNGKTDRRQRLTTCLSV